MIDTSFPGMACLTPTALSPLIVAPLSLAPFWIEAHTILGGQFLETNLSNHPAQKQMR